jgi:hypothetical protein
MTNPEWTNTERTTEIQRRIDEIEQILEQVRPHCDMQLAGDPRPAPVNMQICRLEQLESELKVFSRSGQKH